MTTLLFPLNFIVETVGFEPELMKYRIVVKMGEHTSGTASLRLDGLNA